MFGKYESLVDIVVTTPGRLVDHLKSTDGFTLKHLRYLVIDEADRVVENVQNDWLYHYNKHMNSGLFITSLNSTGLNNSGGYLMKFTSHLNKMGLVHFINVITHFFIDGFVDCFLQNVPLVTRLHI